MSKLKMKRFLALFLAFVMLVGTLPASAYNLDDTPPFPNEDVITDGYLQDENLRKVEDKKYLTIRAEGRDEPFSEGIFGAEPTKSKPISPFIGPFIIEFNQEQTQEIRIELWSEDGQEYLGLINSGMAVGQWGELFGDQYPFDPDNEIDERVRVANYFSWNVKYYDADTGVQKFVAANADGDVVAGIYTFRIVFQPTHENAKQYHNEMYITFDYTDGGRMDVGQLISRDELTDEIGRAHV